MEQEKHTLTNTVECMSTWLTLICATKLYCWQILGVVVEVVVSGATGGEVVVVVVRWICMHACKKIEKQFKRIVLKQSSILCQTQ